MHRILPMEIAHACQVPVQELVKQEFDLLIIGNKPNDRCSFLLNNYNIHSKRTLVLIDADEPKVNRQLNAKLPPSQTLDVLEISADTGEKIIAYFESFISRLKQTEISVLIDYSCMEVQWYASMINYTYLREIKCEKINMYFAYIPVKFLEPRKNSSKHDLQIIINDPVYVNRGITSKALILGLGYNVEKAEFIIQKVKPAVTYFFYSQPAFDERYASRVLQLNDRLLRTSEPGRLFPYPMTDMDFTVEALSRIVLDLRLDNQVVLASFGPKVFNLACVLIFARFPDIEILSAGSDSQSNFEDVPINLPIIYKAVFLSDEICE